MRFVPRAVLALFVLINVFRGCVHAFAPDGGAHSIAGLDLSTNAQTILSLFAGMGFHQLVMAGFQVFVLWKRRDLVTIALVLQTAEIVLGVANLYFYRTLPVEVPGMPFNVANLAILLVALAVAWQLERRAPARSGAKA
ncbi:MAG: hypothetical protein ISS15_01700 [Alphaproteobacteria bacterium]|nr:hypothetical protein [Alphaproteobacteria bacterium]MBL6937092.1 hypothetical protein [Alphaproteobacteria bacterium]MBL7096346.1 hypothetical protein [Alphaproteobacteria bacterium]